MINRFQWNLAKSSNLLHLFLLDNPIVPRKNYLHTIADDRLLYDIIYFVLIAFVFNRRLMTCNVFLHFKALLKVCFKLQKYLYFCSLTFNKSSFLTRERFVLRLRQYIYSLISRCDIFLIRKISTLTYFFFCNNLVSRGFFFFFCLLMLNILNNSSVEIHLKKYCYLFVFVFY